MIAATLPEGTGWTGAEDLEWSPLHGEPEPGPDRGIRAGRGRRS
jgi:hypothetical protein